MLRINMARVALVVTNACAPDPRVERHAGWLAEFGHDTEIHAWDRSHTSLIYEEKNGYKIHRYQIGKTNHSRPFATWKLKKKFLKSLTLDHDLVILNDTDTYGIIYDGLTILDIHDLAHTWPLMRGRTLIHKFASIRMLSQAKKMIYNADEIIVSAPGFQSWVKQKGRESTVVMNRVNAKKIQRCKEKVVGYFGRIREIDSIDKLIQAAKKIDFKVILAGDGADSGKLSDKFPEVDYRGPFTEKDLPELMKEISVMYAMYDESRGNIKSGAIPSKMLDAASYGIPSVVNKGTPMGYLCENENLGKTALYGDIQEISDAILEAHELEITAPKGEDKQEFLSVIQKLIS